MKLPCDVVMDLVGVYKDGIVSRTTKKAVDQHLLSCPKCRKYYKKFDSVGEAPILFAEPSDPFEERFEELSARLRKKHTVNISAISVIVCSAGVMLGYNIFKSKIACKRKAKKDK